MMLILGPLVAPRISALTTYLDSSAAALTTLSPSTTSSAGNVTDAPASPASLSTVSTSSTATFSCLPPQRTIAYTAEPFPCARLRRTLAPGLHRKTTATVDWRLLLQNPHRAQLRRVSRSGNPVVCRSQAQE